MSDADAVLFANEAFYLAFATRDFDAMAAVWSDDEPVSCIHPGWRALTGRAAVLQSWRGILGNPASPPVSCRNAEAHMLGETAVVLCYEELAGNLLVATNVFRRDGNAWRMVHHQAGPCHEAPPLAPEPAIGPLQ